MRDEFSGRENGIDAQAESDFHGIVELGKLYLLQQRYCVAQKILPFFNCLARFAYVLS